MTQIEELKATLSSMEYQIITECAQSNISEKPNLLPPVDSDFLVPSPDQGKLHAPQGSEVVAVLSKGESWTAIKVCVIIDLVEMCLHAGPAGDAPLATVQVQCRFLIISGILNAQLSLYINRSINFNIYLELAFVILIVYI